MCQLWYIKRLNPNLVTYMYFSLNSPLISVQRSSSIYSCSIKLHFLLHSNLWIWVVSYFKFVFTFWRKKEITFMLSTFLVRKLNTIFKKEPSKVVTKYSFFPYCPELPKWPKQKNLCSKMWLIDQLYIKLGPKANNPILSVV